MSGKTSVRELSFDLEGVPVASRNRLLVEISKMAEVCTNRRQRPRISKKGNLIITVDLGNLDGDERNTALTSIDNRVMKILREFSTTNRPVLKS